MIEVFSADAWVYEFVKQNFATLGIIIGFLKILATRSKNTLDDSILGYFGGVVTKMSEIREIKGELKRTKKNGY